MSDPFGGYEGYARSINHRPYKVISEKGELSFVTEDEAVACKNGIQLCGFSAKIEREK